MLKIDSEYFKGILFVRLKGNLTRRTTNKLNNYLVPVIIKHGIKYMVYNLYDLENIDENGKKALTYATLAIGANNGQVYMCEVPEILERKLEDLNINRVSNETKAIELMNI